VLLNQKSNNSITTYPETFFGILKKKKVPVIDYIIIVDVYEVLELFPNA
jgi:hypothetical protein